MWFCFFTQYFYTRIQKAFPAFSLKKCSFFTQLRYYYPDLVKMVLETLSRKGTRQIIRSMCNMSYEILLNLTEIQPK